METKQNGQVIINTVELQRAIKKEKKKRKQLTALRARSLSLSLSYNPCKISFRVQVPPFSVSILVK